MDPILLFPRVSDETIRQSIAIMGARRQGKSVVMDAMRQMTHALRQVGEEVERSTRAIRDMVIVHDEWFNANPFYLEPLPPRDRSQFERGGRYRKPPETKLAKPPRPGMVQVRDRKGNLVWKQLGKGMREATRIHQAHDA